MHTNVSTKTAARKIKSVIDRLCGVDCVIIRDCGSWRVCEDSISGSVFHRVRDLIEIGTKPTEITLDDVA